MIFFSERWGRGQSSVPESGSASGYRGWGHLYLQIYCWGFENMLGRQNVRPYCIANSLTNCLTMWAMAELTAQTDSHLGIGMWKKTERTKGIGEVRERLSLVRMQPFAWEKKRFLWNHVSARIAWSLTSTLRFSTSSAQTIETIVCKFGGDPAICPREEAIFVKSQKCPYHVIFDLNLDLEHILDAGPSGTMVCASLVAI